MYQKKSLNKFIFIRRLIFLYTILVLIINFAFAYSEKQLNAEIRNINIQQNKEDICIKINDDRIPKKQWPFWGTYFNVGIERGIPIKLVMLENEKGDLIFWSVKNDQSFKKFYKNECIGFLTKNLGYDYHYTQQDLKKILKNGVFNVSISSAWTSQLRFKGRFCTKNSKLVSCI